MVALGGVCVSSQSVVRGESLFDLRGARGRAALHLLGRVAAHVGHVVNMVHSVRVGFVFLQRDADLRR